MENQNDFFPFPFPPYDVQTDFMKNLYEVLECGKIGIFESPTGTGKSLSIICGALKWLKDFKTNKKMQLESLLSEKIVCEEDDWFGNFTKKQEQIHKMQDAKQEYALLLEYEERIKKLKSNEKYGHQSHLQKDSNHFKRKRVDEDENITDELIDLEDEEILEIEDKQEVKHVLKIYYASRTHSQLSQFIGEIKRSPFKNDVTVTTLGSRASLCVNESVSKLKNLSLINEHCVDFQKKKGKSKKGCPFLKHDLSDLQNNILFSVRDIEETVQLGKLNQQCPYYASRNTIPDVEIVVLPYNILLHKSTRDTYGIVLKDNVVIIDEAHNLLESINNIYSSEISGTCLQQAQAQLESYYKSYLTRFSPKNLLNINLLLLVLKSFIDSLKCTSALGNQEAESKMLLYNEFITMTGLGHVNFFELVKFCEASHLGHKLHGFTSAKVAKGITPWDDLSKEKNVSKTSGTSELLLQIKSSLNSKNQSSLVESKLPIKSDLDYKPSAFFTFHEFLKALTSPTSDGRILFNKQNSVKTSSIKFLHLNPSSHFEDIIADARSVILAGGTMQPISEFVDQLFLPAGVSPDKITLFSCDHVIPQENLLAVSLASGPCGNTLDFTFNSRKSPQVIKELGSILLNICTFVPGGVVCFFPSYEYEEFIYKELNKTILASIEKKKKIFREPKLSSDVDKVLADYANCIHLASESRSSCSGALIFSIVGGKMSEGINFSDELGRCIVMVGLPYPNKYSIELKEKMLYLNKSCPPLNGKKAGDIYYNNLCMKAVNQSIGRAIRHKNDYASILLLDYRYNNISVKEALPNWISRSLSFHQKFSPAYSLLRSFFSNKNKT